MPKGSSYSTSSQTLGFVFFVFLCLFWVLAKVSHCDFDLRFPKVMFSTICTSSLEREMSVQVLCPLFNGVVYFIVVAELFICLFIYHYFLRISSLLYEVVLGLGQVPNVEYEIPLLRMDSKAAVLWCFCGEKLGLL